MFMKIPKKNHFHKLSDKLKFYSESELVHNFVENENRVLKHYHTDLKATPISKSYKEIISLKKVSEKY